MTKFKIGLFTAVAVLPTLLPAAASAQTSVVATLDTGRALFGGAAIGTALQQIETRYAADIKKADDRATQAQTTTAPSFAALDLNKDGATDRNELDAAVKANRPEVKRIDDEQRALVAENGVTLKNYTNAQLYVFDQVRTRYSAALDSQVQTKKIGLVVTANPQTIVRQTPGTDLTDAISAAVNRPIAIDAPANFTATEETRQLAQAYFRLLEQQQQARQQQQAQQGAAAPQAAAPATRAPAPAASGAKRDRNGDPIK